MRTISEILRQLKAILKPSSTSGMKKIYSDFFKLHEENQVLMLHREDLYTPGPPHKHFSQKMSMASLFKKIETIQSTEYSIQAGTNLRLAMEAMVLKLSRI